MMMCQGNMLGEELLLKEMINLCEDGNVANIFGQVERKETRPTSTKASTAPALPIEA